MGPGTFDKLSTVSFQKRMRPVAIKIYESVFPGCAVVDLREKGVEVHILDQQFGIDSLITLRSGQWISIQEKYRENKFLSTPSLRVQKDCPDFTQEYLNAAGTPHESKGEWFKLGAQFYFYGWASADGTEFEKWVLLDIAKYKMIVERAGGLSALGKLQQNRIHGKSNFYCIPINSLQEAFVVDYKDPGKLMRLNR